MYELEVEWRGGHFSVAGTSPARPRAEQRAKKWLASQPVPVVVASLAPRRTVNSVYVSVSAAQEAGAWVAALKTARRLLAELKSPTYVPEEPRFRLVWAHEPPGDVQKTLTALCQRALSGAEPRPCIGPSIRRKRRGRARRGVPMASQQDESPDLGRDWTIFETVGGDPLSVIRTGEVSDAFRRTLLRFADDWPPAVLTGVMANAATTPIAFVPLPFVDHRHASAQLLGLAIVWPRDLGIEARRAVMRSSLRWEASVRHGESGSAEPPPLSLGIDPASHWVIRRLRDVAPLPSLRPPTWCAASRTWCTATPIALDVDPGPLGDDRHGDDPYGEANTVTAETMVADACVRSGLPRPTDVDVSLSSFLAGGTASRFFPPFPHQPGRLRHALVHARIRFAAPVCGPVLVGAGRQSGLGLCRPTPI